MPSKSSVANEIVDLKARLRKLDRREESRRLNRHQISKLPEAAVARVDVAADVAEFQYQSRQCPVDLRRACVNTTVKANSAVSMHGWRERIRKRRHGDAVCGVLGLNTWLE